MDNRSLATLTYTDGSDFEKSNSGSLPKTRREVEKLPQREFLSFMR